MDRLSEILLEPNILQYVDEIAKIREQYSDSNDINNLTNRIKSKLQDEANIALDNNDGNGAVIMATGVGKSKVAIDRTKNLVNKEIKKDYPNFTKHIPKILLVVPTIKLRDKGWKDEFSKWGYINSWDFIEPVCYDSLHNYKDTTWDMVILDEMHNLTELSATFFFDNNNVVNSLICFTATKPTNPIKRDLFIKLGIRPVFTVTIDEAVKLGVAADYDITIITVPLNSTDKYIKGGNKTKGYFYNTEVNAYNYLTRTVYNTTNPLALINRRRFLCNLRSKTETAKLLLDNVISKDLRLLIFCGSKEQANQLCEHRFYSKPSKPKKYVGVLSPDIVAKETEKILEYTKLLAEYQGDTSLELFQSGAINRLSCVNALNEGHNLSATLDGAFITQLDKNSINMLQRMGRTGRARAGHINKIIILVAENTEDVNWAKKATFSLNQANIKWMTVTEFITNNNF